MKSSTDVLASIVVAVIAGLIIWALVHHRAPELERHRHPDPVPPPPPAQRRLFVYVGGPGCPHCVRMERTTLRDASVLARLADYTVVKTSGREARERYHVTALPTYLILDRDGTERHRGWGYRSPTAFIEWLDRLPFRIANPGEMWGDDPLRGNFKDASRVEAGNEE